MINSTKAETLEFLSKKGFNIPLTFYFNVHKWRRNQESIISKIIKKFKKNSLLAIRSSSKSEDNEQESMAGAFTTLLNIKNEKNDLIQSINKVIDSYDENLLNQVLIQPMVENVKISGVVMTKVLDDGSPYYVINFDDSSGKTDTITSGNSINKTVYIYNGFKESDFDSKPLLAVLTKVKKLESLYSSLPLDIEFAVDKNNEVFILQLRLITTSKKWNKKSNELVSERLPFLEIYINYLNEKRLGIFGNKTLLGIMPDWNPAEMIGLIPRPLSLSLYRELITKKVWRISREEMGYKKLPEVELMVSLFGRPYIDVRNSFNSFLPEKLSPSISEKLVNAYLKRLDKNPFLHDKIEFEVVSTAFDFKLSDNLKERYPNLLNSQEINELKKCFIDLTQNAILDGEKNSLNKSIRQINILESLQKNNIRPKLNNVFSISDHISSLIKQCVEYGTMPFAISARHAFIAESLLKSMAECNAIKKNRISLFKQSIKTISSKLSDDYYNAFSGSITKVEFLKKYGHLRPSSYDILSLNYNEREDLFNGKPKRKNSNIKFELDSIERKKINQLLKKHGLKKFNADDIFSYASKAIKYREYNKYVFTKHLSEILDYIVKWGELTGFSREDLSMLKIEDIQSVLTSPLTNEVKTHFKNIIKNSKIEYKLSSSIKLNYLIRSSKDIYIAPMHRSKATFIGNKRIENEIIYLNPYIKKIPDLNGKIICIEGADPGYDWIFSRKIAGLITKFGGANSHMAIRCSEYNLPAAIGCGEQPFEKIINSNIVILDCQEEKLESLSI